MNSFGLIVLISCFSGILLISEQNKAKVKEIVTKCITDLNLLPPEEQKIRSNDFVNATRNIQCFLDCFNDGIGFTKNGTVQETLALDVLAGEPGFNAEKIKEILGKCSKVKGADKCETAYKMLQCFNENKTKVLQ